VRLLAKAPSALEGKNKASRFGEAHCRTASVGGFGSRRLRILEPNAPSSAIRGNQRV